MDTQENARMSLPETAAFLGCCLRTVFRRVAAGQLSTVRDTGTRRVYVTRSSAEDLLRIQFDRLYGQVK